MGSPSALAASRVARRRSTLHVSTSRGARRPRTRPSTAPSTRSIKAREAANSRRPAAPATTRLGRGEPADPPPHSSIDALEKGEGGSELAPARRLVDDPREPAPLVSHPASRVVARSEISAHAPGPRLPEQGFLPAELAAELHEGRDAVAQELGHREAREQAIARLRVRRVGAGVARISADHRALAGHGDLEEGLAEVVGPAGVGDEAMGGAVAGMDVGIDEAGTDELAPGVDLLVDGSGEA